MTSIKLPFRFKYPVLALGSELKTSFAVLSKNRAYLSKVFEDLKDPGILEDFKKVAAREENKFKPRVIACDLHPDYMSTRHAKEIFQKRKSRGLKARLLEVQHHHAHVAACMAEHSMRGRVIGVAFDGMGYGPDGNIWGGEFLTAGYGSFKREAHIEYVPMPGADRAVLEPARMAFAYLRKAYKGKMSSLKSEVLKRLGKKKCSLFAGMIDKGFNSPLTSSAGRLFDAVSSMIGLRDTISYEGEAAIELEKIAGRMCKKAYKFKITNGRDGKIITFMPMIKAIASDLKRKKPSGLISRKFHNTLAEAIKQVCSALRKKTKINRVVLSGGVFQNKILSEEARKRLEGAGFLVYGHSQTSCADRGLALGQAVVAAFKAT